MALLAALGGCVPKASRGPDAFALALEAADARWAARASAGTLDEAERAYTALLAERPDSPDVLWRLSRLAFSRVMRDPAQAATWHEVGREHALRCLTADPAVRASVLRRGDRLDAALLAEHGGPPECAALGAAHVVGLVRARGAGAALDLEDADALLGVPLPSGAAERALARWADGQRRQLGGDDLTGARAALREAVEAAPGLSWVRHEALAAFPDLEGALPPAEADPAWALENAGTP